MSYGCSISFKFIPDGNVQDFFKLLKKTTGDNIEKFAKENFIFSPALKDYPFETEKELHDKIFSTENHDVITRWARELFTFRFFWDNEHKLLGVFGIDKCVQNIFDATVFFQNSTDQDYDYEIWNGIKLFEDIAEKWKTADFSTVKEAILDYFGDYYEFCETETDSVDYCKRTLCYDEIWKMFSKYLEDEREVCYLSLYDTWDFQPLMQFQSYVKQNIEKYLIALKELK